MSAATITPSDLAPNERVHFSFATVEFDLGGSKRSDSSSYETDDLAVITEAQGHPWLDVQVDEDAAVVGEYIEQLKPEEDVLSWATSVANDPDAAKAAEEAKVSGSFAETLAPEAVSPPVVEATTDIDQVDEPDPTLFTNNEDDE